jgi:catalase
MTSDEYRQVLGKLSEQQRRDLNEHIFKGNQPTVDAMVYTFEKYADVEPKAVFWLTKNVQGLKWTPLSRPKKCFP